MLSFVCAALNGTTGETVAALAEGAAAAVGTVLSFAGIMCFWCGIMRIAEDAGAAEFIRKAINPIVKRLFPRADAEARRHISLNITANLLGLGNAATPAGIRAMEALDKTNAEPSKPSYEMCMLLVLNTTSFQLIPTTIMSLRAAAGGAAESVILPIWISSALSVAAAVAAVKLFCRDVNAP